VGATYSLGVTLLLELRVNTGLRLHVSVINLEIEPLPSRHRVLVYGTLESLGVLTPGNWSVATLGMSSGSRVIPVSLILSGVILDRVLSGLARSD
jgi:hypothetical protein